MMLRRFRKWNALPRAERNVLLFMMLAMPVLEVALHLCGYGRTRRMIERQTQHRAVSTVPTSLTITGERVARLASIAGGYGLVQGTCLRQSLLTYGILRWRGLRPSLVLGVKRVGHTPDMHAWVTLDGVALGQDPLRHAPFNVASVGPVASTRVNKQARTASK